MRSLFHLLYVLLLSFCLVTSVSSQDGALPVVEMIDVPEGSAEYWTRWRGPSGQGWVSGNGYPDTWSDTENVLWRQEIPGRGNSSPIVWDDRIFLTTAYDGGKRRSILCFRRSDGKRLWETFAPETKPEKAHPKNGHASSTPTTDGKHVYAYFGNHGLLAVDFDGKTVWHRSLGSFNAYHGTAGSPLLYRDRLILVQDQRRAKGSFILAVDKQTGRELWRTPRAARVGWNSPIAVRVEEHDEIIFSGQKQVQAYDPETGKELWSARGNTTEAVPTPVVGHNLIFCSSGRAGPTLAIRGGGSGDITDTHIVWQTPKGSPFVPSAVLDGDYLYIVNDMVAVATCFEARTGKLIWRERLGRARREGFSASPVAVNGKIFFTNDDGETFVLKTGPAFKLLHVNRLKERVQASPALVDGRWYFRTEKHLIAIGTIE
ncbi:MAG: PQQ-binding-like beta-propeller repeat protein [Desulfobacterales bacterium]